MSLVYLKVKIKSLAEEARIIRFEEHRAKQPTRNGLTNHRKLEVRPEARAALIAYGYLRGRDYRTIEPKATKSPDWTRIKAMVNKFGDYSAKIEFDDWVKATIG